MAGLVGYGTGGSRYWEVLVDLPGGYIVADEICPRCGKPYDNPRGWLVCPCIQQLCNDFHEDKAGNTFACILLKGHKGPHYCGNTETGFEWGSTDGD